MVRDQERFVGNFLGAMVGDALHPPVSRKWECGEHTDNTSIILCVAESLVKQEGYSSEDIARRIMKKTKKEGPMNGSAMRCAPLSLMYCHDEKSLIEASMEVSAITHNSHAEAELNCVFVNMMIARLLLGDKRPAAYAYAVKKIGKIDQGTINTAILTFMKARSFEEAIASAINADTNGATTGVLAGTYFGRANIPRRWLGTLDVQSVKYFAELGKTLFSMNMKMRQRR